jgi:hypothetical protein
MVRARFVERQHPGAISSPSSSSSWPEDAAGERGLDFVALVLAQPPYPPSRSRAAARSTLAAVRRALQRCGCRLRLEPLDLPEHSPEEWEGKGVSFGADYVVGPYLGSGGERIVHRLVNSCSGLGLFVLKVIRDQPNAAAIAEHALEVVAQLRDLHVPVVEDTMIVHARR